MIMALRRRTAFWSRLRRAFCVLALLGPLGACGSEMPTEAPEPPEPPVGAPVFLESSELLPGGQGILVSAGFVEFELTPAVDENGAVIPARWTNLRVTIDGTEVDSRRFDATRMEFDVPVRMAGDATVRVETPATVSTTTGRVRGLLSSRRVDDCAAHDFTTLVALEGEVVLSLYCPFDAAETDWRLGYASLSPGADDPALRWIDGLYLDDESADGQRTAVIHPGPSTRAGHFVARRPGPSSEPLDMWVWAAGAEPAPAEPLTCFPDASGDDVSSAPADLDGSCVAFQAGFLRRDAVPIAECCPADGRAVFVLSSDGSAALRHVADLVVFDPQGGIVYRLPYGQIIDDVRFSANGDRVFVAVGGTSSSRVDVRDRETSELLDGLDLEGRVTTLAVVGNRLWLARKPVGGGPFAVELYDARTLSLQRTLALPRAGLTPPGDELTGAMAVLQENGDGTRLYLTSLVGGIVRSDVIEVF